MLFEDWVYFSSSCTPSFVHTRYFTREQIITRKQDLSRAYGTLTLSFLRAGPPQPIRCGRAGESLHQQDGWAGGRFSTGACVCDAKVACDAFTHTLLGLFPQSGGALSFVRSCGNSLSRLLIGSLALSLQPVNQRFNSIVPFRYIVCIFPH